MSKPLWFSIAILFYCVLAAEALTCKRHKKFKIRPSSINEEPSKICIAEPGQKCKITRYQGKSSHLFAQACTKSIDECHLTLGLAERGAVDVKCCDDSDLCNTP